MTDADIDYSDNPPLEEFLNSVNIFSKDFMKTRKQPVQQKREDLFDDVSFTDLKNKHK